MPPAKLKEKAKAIKTKEMQASPLKASRKRPASSIPLAEAQPPSLVRAKKVKGDPEEGNQGSEEEAPFAKPVESTTEDREKRIKELEELVGDLQATISSLRSDKTFMHGVYDAWPQLFIGDWSKSLGALLFQCHNWSSLYGFSNRAGKYAHLSKEQKRRLITNMKGFVLQDDFDKIVPQLPPNIRCGILKYFAGIIVVKEIFDLFFSNPFWYLEWPDNQSPNDAKESGVETPFGAQLNHLYNLFLQTEPQLARHWRAQTTRLSNATGTFQSRDTTFGLKNLALREAKVKQVVAARLADESFQWLLKDAKDERRDELLFYVYKRGAELAMEMATSQPDLVWRTLDDLPPLFYRTSNDIEAAHMHGLQDRDSRLNGHRVLAVTRPSFWQAGGWNRDGKDKIIAKANVLVEDPIGYPEDALSTDEEVREKRKQRQAKRAAKKANDEKAGKEKPPPKAKAKKATKKKS